MKTRFVGKKISSILTVLPQNDVFFDDEVENYSFPEKQTMRLKRVMGYNKHSISKEGSTVYDFACVGLKYMLDNEWIKKEDIGAVVVVTLCPDYFVPHISNLIHGEMKLSKDVFCMDIPQGCCGFIMGLMQAFLLLDHMCGKKVVLVNGDVLSHKVSKHDRNEYPLVGDGATISIIEKDNTAKDIFFDLYTDGSQALALQIPAGGFRMPCTPETAEMKDDGSGNLRSLNCLCMEGDSVFNFVQTEVPPMISELLKMSGVHEDEIDYYLFHQPNRFMLEKLREAMEIPEEKVFMNLVENYGNTSGASIPMIISLNLNDEICDRSFRCCLGAFGSGLTWGGMVMDIGPMDHCDTIRSDL